MKKQNILAFRLSAIGDIAMTVPVIIETLKQNPQCKITMVAPAFLHSFFPNHERLTLIDFDKKNKHKGLLGIYRFYKEIKTQKFDAFADLHNVLRSIVLGMLFRISGTKVSVLDKGRKEKKALTRKQNKVLKQLKHTTERYADVFRKLGLKVELNHELKNYLYPNSEKKTNAIGIAPFAKHNGKMYPLDKMRDIALKLAEKGCKLYIFGSKQEAELLQNFSHENIEVVAGKFRFKEELELMSTLNLMISMDSSNMHMASLVGIPVVSIWGDTHPFAGFLGYGQSMENVVQDNNLTCRPISIFGDEKADIDTFANITINDILEKVENALK